MSNYKLLHLASIPVYQNRMFESESGARACLRGDLVLAQDSASGLVHNEAFDPAKLEYNQSYQNEQGHSPVFRDHIAVVLGMIERHFGRKTILEIGCGKGAFLDLLLKAGHEAKGIDPAYEGNSPHIIPFNFSADSGVRGEAIIMRHVLEHIQNPLHFLHQIRNANGNGGLVYIEVPCLEWILEHRAWFDLFYEHVNYFRLEDFQRLFGRVIESGKLFGGQYIYAFADLASLRDPKEAPHEASRANFPSDFFIGLDECAAIANNASSNAVWGGAAKGVMFAHHMQARGAALNLAIDINPAKQGKFMAGSGLPILPPEEGLAMLGSNSNVFVMNSNYLAEIQAMGGADHNYIAVEQT